VNEDLRALADEYWEYTLRTEPTTAHMLGDYRYIDQFEDASREAENADIAAKRSFAQRARAIDESELTSSDKTTLETLVYEAESNASIAEMRQAEFGIDPIFGPHLMPQLVFPQMTVETPEHAAKMLDKYVAFARHLDQSSKRLEEGVANGRVNAEFAVTRTVGTLDAMLEEQVDDSPYLAVQLPDSLSDEEKATWHQQAAAIVRDTVNPALERYRDVIRDQVGPIARPNDQAGLFALNDGDLVYSRLVDRYTTLSMQAELWEQRLSRRSSRRCGMIHPFTTLRVRASWPPQKQHLQRLSLRWAIGSDAFHNQTVSYRKPRVARLPTTSRRPRTARAKAPSS